MKIYKKGTKIKLCCCTHDVQSNDYEIITLTQDETTESLNDMARDFMENSKEPEYWFEVLKEGE